jgi:hypothetical protein
MKGDRFYREPIKIEDVLDPGERALLDEARVNAEPTGDEDNRSKSALRRQVRRLLAIIDKLLSMVVTNYGAKQ